MMRDERQQPSKLAFLQDELHPVALKQVWKTQGREWKRHQSELLLGPRLVNFKVYGPIKYWYIEDSMRATSVPQAISSSHPINHPPYEPSDLHAPNRNLTRLCEMSWFGQRRGRDTSSKSPFRGTLVPQVHRIISPHLPTQSNSGWNWRFWNLRWMATSSLDILENKTGPCPWSDQHPPKLGATKLLSTLGIHFGSDRACFACRFLESTKVQMIEILEGDGRGVQGNSLDL